VPKRFLRILGENSKFNLGSIFKGFGRERVVDDFGERLRFHLNFIRLSNSTRLTIVSTTISFPSPPPSPLEGERGRVRGIRCHSCHSLSSDVKVLLEKEDGKGRKWKN
jgi:hypothetical protein